MAEELFYILHFTQNDEGHMMSWWTETPYWYTTDLDSAWKLDKRRALEICSCRTDEDFACKVEEVDRIVQREVPLGSLEKLRVLGKRHPTQSVSHWICTTVPRRKSSEVIQS